MADTATCANIFHVHVPAPLAPAVEPTVGEAPVTLVVEPTVSNKRRHSGEVNLEIERLKKRPTTRDQAGEFLASGLWGRQNQGGQTARTFARRGCRSRPGIKIIRKRHLFGSENPPPRAEEILGRSLAAPVRPLSRPLP